MTLRNPSFENAGSSTGTADEWTDSATDLGTVRGRLESDSTFTATDGDRYYCLGSNNPSEEIDWSDSITAEVIGTGTSGDDDEFSDTLAEAGESVFVVPGSVIVKNGVTTKAVDADGAIAGVGLTGWINYFSGEISITEESTDVWTTDEDVTVDYDVSSWPWTQTIKQIYVDLTDHEYLRFDNQRTAPSSFTDGSTWTFAVLIDDVIVESWVYNAGDESSSTNETTNMDISSYSGLHSISFRITCGAGDVTLFDDGLKLVEDFENWTGTIDQWIETASSLATFDDGAETTETFEEWSA